MNTQPAYAQYTPDQQGTLTQADVDLAIEISKLSADDRKIMVALLNALSGKCKTENRCTLPR